MCEEEKLKRHIDLLTDQRFKKRGTYHIDAAQKMIEGHLKLENDFTKYLLNLMEFETSHRMFIDEESRLEGLAEFRKKIVSNILMAIDSPSFNI
ncbi:MAG: hypothetical protein K8R74_02425 [Bacteroidales bacterium]|nr:hypothetical protein [Bacteroidales bacterium]